VTFFDTLQYFGGPGGPVGQSSPTLTPMYSKTRRGYFAVNIYSSANVYYSTQ